MRRVKAGNPVNISIKVKVPEREDVEYNSSFMLATTIDGKESLCPTSLQMKIVVLKDPLVNN